MIRARGLARSLQKDDLELRAPPVGETAAARGNSAGLNVPITGIVITLPEERALQRAVLDALRETEGVTLGPFDSRRVPCVVEDESMERLLDVIDALRRLAGVVGIEVAYLDAHDGDDGLPASRAGTAA